MTGLLLQKFFCLKRTIRLYLLFMIFYIVLGMLNGSMSSFGAFFVLFASFLPISSFAFEERSKWDLYANTMPVTRQQIVGSHYIFMAVTVLSAALLNAVLMLVEVVLQGGNLLELLELDYGILLVGMLFQLIAIPIIIKLGSTSAQLVMVAIYMIPFAAVMILLKLEVELPSAASLRSMIPFSPVLLLLLAVLSYYLSLDFYQKKDL